MAWIIDSREPTDIALSVERHLPPGHSIEYAVLPEGDLWLIKDWTGAGGLPDNIGKLNGLCVHLGASLSDLTSNGWTIEQIMDKPTDAALALLGRQALAIERKTANDLLGSLRDGRLFNQAMRLKRHTKYPFIVVTGSVEQTADGKVIANGRETGWSMVSVRMAQNRVEIAGVPIFDQWARTLLMGAALVQEHQSYVDTVLLLWGWLTTSQEHGVPSSPPKPLLPMDERVELLCGFPGIGPELATSLLDQCGSVIDVIRFLCDLNTDDRVHGIGPQKKLNVIKLLGIKEGELIIVTKNDLTPEEVVEQEAKKSKRRTKPKSTDQEQTQ